VNWVNVVALVVLRDINGIGRGRWLLDQSRSTQQALSSNLTGGDCEASVASLTPESSTLERVDDQ
jgi:predicted RNA-binding protein YlxR (DUF448 family)